MGDAMKTQKYVLMLFVFAIMAAACSREEYRPATLGRLGGGGWEKVCVSGVPFQNWLDNKYYNGYGQRCSRLQLCITNGKKDEKGYLVDMLDAD